MADLATAARPYANAAFDAARQSDQLAGWSQALRNMSLVTEDPVVKIMLGSPSIADSEKARNLCELCGEEISEVIRRFIYVLAENKRLTLLPGIFEQFEASRMQEEKSLDVEIISAYEMDAEQENRLASALHARFDRDIKLVSSVDPSLLGGAVIRAGDTVIDGSIRGKIGKLAETLQRV